MHIHRGYAMFLTPRLSSATTLSTVKKRRTNYVISETWQNVGTDFEPTIKASDYSYFDLA